MDGERLNYRSLATALATLPLAASLSDIDRVLDRALVEQPEHLAAIKAAMRRLPGNAGWIDGLFAVCDVLQERNPRFVPAIMMDWSVENI